MRLGYAAGLGLPRRLAVRLRGRPRGAVSGSRVRDALAALAEAVAPRSLWRIVLPSVYEPPLIALVRAGRCEEAVKLDYNHLYARLAADILADYGYRDEAEWFRGWVRRREELPPALAERYVLLSSPTAFARAYKAGYTLRHSACRRFWGDAAEEPPLTWDELVELMDRVPCEMHAVRVKDVVKYIPHIVVGLSRRRGTGLWERVVTAANEELERLAAPFREAGALAALYVDSVIACGDASRPRTRYPYKVEARGAGLVVLPPLYRVGERYGVWAVYREPPVRVEKRLSRDGFLVWLGAFYEGAVSALRCEKPLTVSAGTVREAAAALELRVGRVLCDIEDRAAGALRLFKRAVEALVEPWAAERPHVPVDVSDYVAEA